MIGETSTLTVNTSLMVSNSLTSSEAYEFVLFVFKNQTNNNSVTAYQIWEDGFGDVLQ